MQKLRVSKFILFQTTAKFQVNKQQIISRNCHISLNEIKTAYHLYINMNTKITVLQVLQWVEVIVHVLPRVCPITDQQLHFHLPVKSCPAQSIINVRPVPANKTKWSCTLITSKSWAMWLECSTCNGEITGSSPDRTNLTGTCFLKQRTLFTLLKYWS